MKSVLVANRGEIAVRVIRACRELGLESIAVYSEADRTAPHVALADRARCIGPAPSSESYLRADRILAAATELGVDAVHPGYGFLSEQAAFATMVEAAGLVFVGPTPETIAAMGDKSEARRRMQAAGVQVVPGTDGPVEDAESAGALARDIGFPLLLKAVAGGGGKGMRIVQSPGDLPRALEAARREAEGAFGDGRVYMERYLGRPRHIEIQLLGDGRGRVVHLGERECSIQRRHQKLVEEAPSPGIDASVRAAMGRAAVEAAAVLDYRGVGTVEFLFQDGEFYFLEMNTRIQVEHPVTELVTGIDLVQWQLRVASGEPLPFEQDQIRLEGHAIECRVTAESPEGGFLPATGTVDHFVPPSGPSVRWDGGIAAGSEIGLTYDPLLGKLIVHATTRDEAIRRMSRALSEMVVVGVDTSVSFLSRVMEEADFVAGELSIRYLDEHPDLLEQSSSESDLAEIAAVAACLEWEHRTSRSIPRVEVSASSIHAWRRALDSGRGHR